MREQVNEKVEHRYNMLGVSVDGTTMNHLISIVSDSIQGEKKITVTHHNLHSVYVYHRDRKMRSLFGSSYCTHIDGMPLIFMGKMLGYPLKREHRITSLDFLPLLLPMAEKKGWKLFYLGSRPGVAELGAKKLLDRYPRLIVDTHHGYFELDDEGRNSQVVRIINSCRPDILIVGMGVPLQEHWVYDNLSSIDVNVVFTWGACIDYIAGVIPTPPRWMGKAGLEWLYRLVSEPGRLWKRYLVEPWFVLGLFIKDLWIVYIKRDVLQALPTEKTRQP